MKGNVIIVDTPGIGDVNQEEVAKLMMDYIPKALAFVFVLNVANAGGIQQDRVFNCLSNSNFTSVFIYPLFMEIDSKFSFQITRVIKHVKKSFTTMPCFCPKDVIFVLNKWDVIRREEDKKEFLKITHKNLHELWEEIEDNNIKTLAAVRFFFSERAQCS